ncbi:MAG: hypothetical protein AB4911_20095 [Oscillochloridaceae bacterium umkhey_bin13]
MQHRLADLSGPFFDPHKPFRNWSAFPFSQIDQPAPPYVDTAQLRWGLERAKAHLHTLHAQGYTGVVLDNLAHLTTFDGPGPVIYAPNSPVRLRALAYRAAIAELGQAAAQYGLDLFVTTDMQWSTPELRAAAGPLVATNPQLAVLNQRAVRELFAALPWVRGLVVRVGEAGGAHNEGEAYMGHLIYSSVAALRSLIATLLPICEANDRLLIMRTWSLGIGELGDLVCSPERYQAVFGDQRSGHLVVSIKHTPADFFRHLPPNPTLGLPGPRQIIELQNRREYELFGLVPSAVAKLHGKALARAQTSPQSAGLWAWNSTGGWGGGQATLGPHGWNLWTELNSALTLAMATNPAGDAPAFVRTWLATRLEGAPALAQAATDLYLASERLLEDGWYLAGPEPAGRIGGVYLAPLLWVWWMRPTAALPIWAYLAATVGPPEVALRRSAAAQNCAAEYAQRLAELAPSHPDGPFIATSAHYLAEALALAHQTRALMLPLFQPTHQPQPWAPAPLRAAAQATLHLIAAHQTTWGARHDFPALELAELTQFAQALINQPQRMQLQIRTAVAAVELARHGRSLGWLGAAGATGLALALLSHRRGRIGLAGLAAGLAVATPLRRQAVSLALPWLSRRLRLLPSIFFETGPAVGEWAA